MIFGSTHSPCPRRTTRSPASPITLGRSDHALRDRPSRSLFRIVGTLTVHESPIGDGRRFRDDRVAALEPHLPVESVPHVSAGPGNFPGFRHHVIERSCSRIIAYLNISFASIYGFSRNMMVGECREIMLCGAGEAVDCAREHLDLIVGMKVRDRLGVDGCDSHGHRDGGGRPSGRAGDGASRLSAAVAGRGGEPAAVRRRADPLLQAVPQRRARRARQDPRGDPGGARARGVVRYRLRHGLARFRRRPRADEL